MNDQPTHTSKKEIAEMSSQSQDDELLVRNDMANREILLPIFVAFLSFFTSGTVGFLLFSIFFQNGLDDAVFYSSAVNGVLGTITSYVSWYLFRTMRMSGPMLASLTLFSSIWLPLYFSGSLSTLSNVLADALRVPGVLPTYAFGVACVLLPHVLPALIGGGLVVLINSGIAERVLMGRLPQIHRDTTENIVSLK